MKAIAKVYQETGSREDWETIIDCIINVPDGTNLYKFSETLNKKFIAALGSDYNRNSPYWVVLSQVDEVDSTLPLAEGLVKALKSSQSWQELHDDEDYDENPE